MIDIEYAEKLLYDYKEVRNKFVLINYEIDRYAVATSRNVKQSFEMQFRHLEMLFEKERQLLNLRNFILDGLSTLDREHRKCLIHYYIKGLKYRNIENLFNCSRRTYYRRRKKSIEMFAQVLDEIKEKWLDDFQIAMLPIMNLKSVNVIKRVKNVCCC